MTPTTARLLLAAASLLPVARAPAQDGVSQAGAALTRAAARRGIVPPAATFVVRDILNQRRHDIALPAGADALSLDLRFDRPDDLAPGRTVHLQVGVATAAVGDPTRVPPVSLALAIDCSGSMREADKLERVKQGLVALVARLRPTDHVALIAWSDTARVVRSGRPVGDGCELRAAIATLQGGGSTNLHGGLMSALAELAGTRRIGGSNRVVLLTDGIANCGIVDPDTIAADAALLSDAGIDVTTIGFGADVQSDLLRRIAERGRSAFHYVADDADIAKVFVDEVQSLVTSVARRIRVELELDPDLHVLRTFGPAPTEGPVLAFDLEDMGLHASQIALVDLALRPSVAAKRRFAVRARLRWVDAATGAARERSAVASLCRPAEGPVDETADGAAFGPTSGDLEVLRNRAIAELAEGMRAMADACARGDTADAQRRVNFALCLAGADPRVAGHPDVAAVIATAARFRDLLGPGARVGDDR